MPIAMELNSAIIEPFVYRQYLDYGVFESLRDMKALIDLARRSEVESVFLEVRRSNPAARALYYSCGFNEVGVRRNGE